MNTNRYFFNKLSLSIFILMQCYLLPLSAQSVTDTITILSFNDFHGAFTEDENVSGAAVFSQALIDAKNSHPHPIVVSAGDNFSGSYFSRITRGEPIQTLFDSLNVEVSAIGNHEFDWGVSFLRDTASKWMDYVAANIYQKENHQRPNWLQPYKIIEKQLKNGKKIKIAFVGLTTTETPQKTNKENLENLEFIHPLGAAAIESLVELKKEGEVDMIVLLTHLGTNMDSIAIFEEQNAKLLPYLDNINAIITGHSHKVVLSEINHVPIIQANTNGTHIGKLQFEIKMNDKGKNEVRYIGGDTMKIQSRNFNSNIDSLIKKYLKYYKFDEELAKNNDNLIHDRNINGNSFTAVGAYVTDAYVSAYNQALKPTKDTIVVGVNHFKGIRTGISKGEVTKLKAGNVLPFGGGLVAYYFNGKQLKALLNSGLTNKNGYLQTSNLRLVINNDTIQDIYHVKNHHEKKIEDESPVILVLDSYITNGDDGYNATLFKEKNKVTAFNQQKLETTQVFIEYLRGKKISEEKAPKVMKNI